MAATATVRGVKIRRQLAAHTEEIVALIEWGAVELCGPSGPEAKALPP